MAVVQRLDRVVEIQERSVTRDDYGGEIESWSELAKVFASVRVTGVQERYLNEAEREQATRNAVMRIRYRTDVTETMRVIYQEHAWDIMGMDEVGYKRFLDLTVQTEIGGQQFMPTALTLMAGLSADAVPEASELTIDHDDGQVDFPIFTGMHILLWRLGTEPDIRSVLFSEDATQANQIAGFARYGTQIDLNGADGNVWVSNQLLSFSEAMSLEVA